MEQSGDGQGLAVSLNKFKDKTDASGHVGNFLSLYCAEKVLATIVIGYSAPKDMSL